MLWSVTAINFYKVHDKTLLFRSIFIIEGEEKFQFQCVTLIKRSIIEKYFITIRGDVVWYVIEAREFRHAFYTSKQRLFQSM